MFTSQGKDDPTDEEITKILRKESAYVAATLASISRTARTITNNGPDIGTNDINLSELVELRAEHETLQAQKITRNSTQAVKGTEETQPVGESSDFKQARKEIVQKFHQLLRDADAEGERVGTGLHRNRVWTGEGGNALNAAKAAESRTNKVCDPCHRIRHRATVLTIWKATVKRRNIFAGITLTRQPGGVPVLPDAGVGKLYPLVCEGEGNGGWKGSSWGFVFVKDSIILSNGTLHTL